MATPTRQPKRRSGHLAAATAAIVDWARHWWSGSNDRNDRDSRVSPARPQDLYRQPVDRRSLWHDGAIVVGGLVIATLLVGGGIWAVLHHLDQTQNNAPAKTKRAARSAAHEATDRGLQLSTVALPTSPKVGQTLIIPLRALDTNGVEQTVLYDGEQVVSRQPGMATSVTWTPSTPGTHELKVAVQLDNNQQAVSAALPIQVSGASRPASPKVPGNITATAQTLVNAINSKNWNALRRIDPSKSGWTDQKLNADYRTLEKDTLVPLSSTPGSNGAVHLYSILVANELSRTELFCVTWDVDPAARTAIQANGRSARNPLPAGANVGLTLGLQLAATCASG
jgi:hypothetical protein